mgnify:CR=1 FL=1
MFDIDNIMLSYLGYDLSYLEFWVTLMNLWSVIAFRRNSIWAYPTSIVACTGLAIMFYQINLYSDQLLNVYYVAISIVGWMWWLQKTPGGAEKYPITTISAEGRVAVLALIVFGTLILGGNIDAIFSSLAEIVAFILGTTYTHIPAQMPYWDAFTTVASMVAMYMLTKRYVESWVLWALVNIVCIALYWYRGVYFLSLEYVVFLVNSIYAYIQWKTISDDTSNLYK